MKNHAEVESKKKKVYFVSLGCPKNLVDSEIMLGQLKGADYEVTDKEEEADAIIVNTCGFIEESKKESIDTILEMSKYKKEGKLKQLVVAGCLAQRYKGDLVEGLPEADVFIGSGEFQNIHEILNKNQKDSTQKTFFNLPTYLQEDSTPRVNSQPFWRAYLKISEGCMKRCAFCAIPQIRGNLQSRTLDSVVKEAKHLVKDGVRELMIISHDFTDYGWDLRRKDPERTEAPVELLRTLSNVEGLHWIRLLYLYPDGITPEMVDLIKSKPQLVKYFDMPLQHINNDMLKKMNRKMTRQEITQALDRIRTSMPEAVIRTQFIVGFPGETEEHFLELLEFIKGQRFDRVGCFKYSVEEKTAAGKMTEQVDEKTKERRYNMVMEAQQTISRDKHRDMIGRRVEVVVEGYSEETDLLLKGRTSQQAPEIDGIVYINEGEAKVGDFVWVEITDSMDYDLVGRIICAPSQKDAAH